MIAIVLANVGEALTTHSAGNLVRTEVNRKKQSALWAVAPIEIAGGGSGNGAIAERATESMAAESQAEAACAEGRPPMRENLAAEGIRGAELSGRCRFQF